MVTTRGRQLKGSPSAADDLPPAPRRSGRQTRPTEKVKSTPKKAARRQTPKKKAARSKKTAHQKNPEAPTESDQKAVTTKPPPDDAKETTNDAEETTADSDQKPAAVDDAKSPSMLDEAFDDGYPKEKTAYSADSKPHTLADAKEKDAAPAAKLNNVTERKKNKYRRLGDKILDPVSIPAKPAAAASLVTFATDNETRRYEIGSEAGRFLPAESPDNSNNNPPAEPAEAPDNSNNNPPAEPAEAPDNSNINPPAEAVQGQVDRDRTINENDKPNTADEEDTSPDSKKVSDLFKGKPKRQYDDDSDSDSSEDTLSPSKSSHAAKKQQQKPGKDDALSDSESSASLSPPKSSHASKKQNPRPGNKRDGDETDDSLDRMAAELDAKSVAVKKDDYKRDLSPESPNTFGEGGYYSDSEDNVSRSTKPAAVKKAEGKIKSEMKQRDSKWKSPLLIPIIDADKDAAEPSTPPLVTFPFDGLEMDDVELVESRLKPKLLTVALVTKTKSKRRFSELTTAPFFDKDKRRLLSADALADNLFCFVRNWMGRYGFTEKVVWLEPYFWWQLSDSERRGTLVKKWATTMFRSLVENFLIAVPIIEAGHVSTALIIEPRACLLGPRSVDEVTRVLHLDSWRDEAFHSTDAVVSAVSRFLLDVGDEARHDLSCPYRLLPTREETNASIDDQESRAEFVTTQDAAGLDCLLHTLHNTYATCKLVEKLNTKNRLQGNRFEESLEQYPGFTFLPKSVEAFRRDIDKLAGELKKIADGKCGNRPTRRPLQKADGNARMLNIPPQAPAAGNTGSPEADPRRQLKFRAQNDPSRSAQKARKRVAKDGLQVRKNNSNSRKRKKGIRPTKAPQQVDDRMRRQLSRVTSCFEPLMMMTTPITKSDDFAQVEEMTTKERRHSAEESQWPDTIPGAILYTEQQPNGDRSSSVAIRDLFLDKPSLTLLVPSQQQGLKLLDSIRKNEIEVKLVTSGDSLMDVTRQPKIVRTREPSKPRSSNQIYSKIGATNLIQSGKKNENTP